MCRLRRQQQQLHHHLLLLLLGIAVLSNNSSRLLYSPRDPHFDLNSSLSIASKMYVCMHAGTFCIRKMQLSPAQHVTP